jgi:flagellar hook protein FlgE
MSFQQGLSGLSAASQNLDVIGNNVANSETVGFKQSTTEFADVYAGAQASAVNTEAGLGTEVASIQRDFTQGAVTTTGNPLDFAINGNGFFQLSQNGATQYTRNGQFSLDSKGDIVNASGAQLTGYPAVNGVVTPTASPVPLTVPTNDLPAKTTSTISAGLNLDADATTMSAASFDPNNSSTYNFSSTVNVYDSLGDSHALTTYYVPTGQSASGENTWDVFASSDGTMIGGSPATPVGTLAFNTSGAIDTANSTFPSTLSIPSSAGASNPISATLDFTGTTQFGAASSVNALSQNGYTSGTLSSYAVGSDGTLTGTYSNGQTQELGQVALVNFAAPTQLQSLGNNDYAATSAAGTPLVGAPSTGSLGSLQSGAVESSNVDLTTQLVDMITAQRDYQANAQTIKTEDALMQTLVSLE